MIPKYIFFSVIAGISVFFSTACSLSGLEPFSGKHSELPLISMQFSQLASGTDRTVSRAIVQGDGFLYIRTQGGPTGDRGPFYGPYSVKAHTDFTTNDIPEGSFSSVMIIYSAEALDGAKVFAYNGSNYPFSSLMALPDADFNSFAGTSSATSTALGEYFDGKVSFGEQKNVTLEAGKTTSISLTLIPITATGSTIDLSKTPGKLFSSTTPTKNFYRLEGLSVPTTKVLKSFECSLIGVTGTTNKLDKVDFYDRNGKLLISKETGTDIASGMIVTLDPAAVSAALDATGYLELFMYFEYSGSMQATFSYSITDATPVTTGGNYTFAITGASAQTGKHVDFVLHTTDGTKINPSTTGVGYMGYGSFVIAADGTGSGTLINYNDNVSPVTMITGDYILTAFIDANGNSAPNGLADAGDYVYILGLGSVLHLDFATPKTTTVNFSSFTNWTAGWDSYSTESVTIMNPGTFAGKNAYLRFSDTTSTDIEYLTVPVGSATTTVSCQLRNGTWMLDGFIDMDGSGVSFMPNPGDYCISSRVITVNAVNAGLPTVLMGVEFSILIPPTTPPVTTGGNYTFAITGAGSQAGKQVDFLLYPIDDTKITSTSTGVGYWGYGSFKIAADGTGTGTLLGFDDNPVTMITGDYILMAFIDANGTASAGSILGSSADLGDFVYIQGIDSVMHLDFATPKTATVNFSNFTNWSAGWNTYSTVTMNISAPGTFAGKNAYLRFSDTASSDVQYFTVLVGSATTTVDCPLPNGSWKLDGFIDMDGSGASLMPNPGDYCISQRAITVSADMSVNLTGADFNNLIPPTTTPVDIGIILPDNTAGTRWPSDLSGMISAIGTSATCECMYSNGKAATELTETQALIAKGIKVLIIFPWDTTNCIAAAAAKAAGVQVIAYDRLIMGSANVDYYITFDALGVGAAQAQFLVDQAVAAGGSGYPLFLYSGFYDDSNAHMFFMGAWSVLQPKILDGTFIIKNSPAAASLVSSNTLTEANIMAIFNDSTNWIDTQWDSVTAANLATRDLAANSPGTGKVFILAPNDLTARAISDIFRGSVTNANLYITGQDAEKASVQYIIDGKQSMTVFKDFRILGQEAAYMALDIISGITPGMAFTLNNGVKNVPSLSLSCISVTRSQIQSDLIDSGFYTAADFTGL